LLYYESENRTLHGEKTDRL